MKTTSVQVRLSNEEKEKLDRKASNEGISSSDWIRSCINEEVSVAKELRSINSKLREIKNSLK